MTRPFFVLSFALPRSRAKLGQDRWGGIEGALLQGGPKVGDPPVDVPQPGRGLRLQALALRATLRLGSQPHFLKPRALPLQLRYLFPDAIAPFRHPLIIPGGRLLPVQIGLGSPLSQKRGPGEM